MKTTTENQTCELTQLAISDAIDTNESLNSEQLAHINSCPECAEFQQLWLPNSPVTAIASGILTEQQNLTQPIISQLEIDSEILPLAESNPTHPTANKNTILWIASIAAVIAIISAFSFHGPAEDQPNIANINDAKNSEETLRIKTPNIEINLTEAKIEHALEENYQNLSKSATQKWRTAKTGIVNAKEYIANGTQYISTKYLQPQNDGASGPQSRLTPQLDEPSPHQYG